MLKLKRISYLLNNTCNLHCSHCFQNSKYRHGTMLDPEDAFKATKYAIDHNTSTNKEIEITLIGGEPMLYNRFPELKKSFDYIFEKGYTISYLRIFTNGTIINKEMLDLLTELKHRSKYIIFFLTLDLDETHPDRISLENKSYNNIIIENAKKLKDFDVYYQYLFSPKNVKNYKNILMKIIEDTNISMDYVYPQKEDFDINDFEYMINTFLDTINNMKDFDYNLFYRAGMCMLIDIYNRNFGKFKKLDKVKCDPIKGEFSISPKGYIIPCVKVLELESEFEKFHIDNIIKNPNWFEDPKIKRYLNYRDESDYGLYCDDCIFNDYCHECRLFPSLIKNDNNHINHTKTQCDRASNMYKAVSNILKKRGGKIWQEKKF